MNLSAGADFDLLNRWQRGFPLEPRPFARIAEDAGLDADDVLERYRAFVASDVLSRIGMVFRPNRVGASTLAAMRVAPEALEQDRKSVV